MVTEKEFDSLPPRLQEQVRRYASAATSAGGWQQYYTPQVAPTQFRRVGEFRQISTPTPRFLRLRAQAR